MEVETLTTKEAAEIADMRTESIARACRRGTLKAKRFGRSWMIERADLEAYMADKPKGGRPKKE